MKKCDLLQECFAKIPSDINKEINLSFAIVDRIHYLLKCQNKTQKDLAIALGKKESEISKWMRGTHNFTIKTLAKISAVLGENIIEIAEQPKLAVTVILSGPQYYTQEINNVHTMHAVNNEKPDGSMIWQSTKSYTSDQFVC